MQYKTIVMEMLEFRTQIKDRLAQEENLLEALDRLALELQALHENYKEYLAHSRIGSHPTQISSEALEMALQELEDRLLLESPVEEPETFSLDGAMAFLRNHMRRK